MIIFLQKTIVLLCMPVSLVVAFLLAACLTKKRWPSIVALILLYGCSLPITSTLLLEQVEGGRLKLSAQEVPKADAVVVLGGFLSTVQSSQGLIFDWGVSSRFFAGLDLMRANKAHFLIFTDEQLPWSGHAGSASAFLRGYAQTFGVPAEQILETNPVQSTQEEALALKMLSKSHTIKSILLVTSAFHMQRAAAQFEKEGFTVYAYPADFRGGGGKSFRGLGLWDFIPNVGALGNVTIALTEIMARAYYWIKLQ